MNDTKIPASTPFSVYCQARAVTAMGREYPTSMCGNDPRLLFAAMVGVEDAIRFRHKETPYPTEGEFLMAVGKAFDSPLGIVGSYELRAAEAALVVPSSLALIWDGADEADHSGDDVSISGPAQSRIVDVIIGGRFRPTRATWQKLIDAGLPMCSWEEASESWDLETVSAEPRPTEDDGIQLRRIAEGGRHGVMAADVDRWRSNGWLEPEGWKLTDRGRKIALSTP